MLAREAGCLAAVLRRLQASCDGSSCFAASQRLLLSTAADAPAADATSTRGHEGQDTHRGRQRRGGRPSAQRGRGGGDGLTPEKQSLRWGQNVVVKAHKEGGSGRDRGKGAEGFSLAHANAPAQVLQLIGDPRTGVADNTTTKPWGEMTVDLLHEAYNSQVDWYKYDLAGNQLHDTHRDARLSDYTRNLIYLLRAKDPARWSIRELARKFRIRPQRVLAILANKEMEAQAMERGEALGGALRGYALPVHLADLHLDAAGEPLDFQQPPPAAAAHHPDAERRLSGSGSSSSGRGAAASGLGSISDFLETEPAAASAGSTSGGALGSISDFVDLAPATAPSSSSLPQQQPPAEDLAAASSRSLPAAVAATHDMASGLGEALRGALGQHGFSLEALRGALEAQLAQAEAFCQQHFADRPDVAAALDLPARRAQVGRLLDALAPLCGGEGLRLAASMERLRAAAQQLQALQAAAGADGAPDEVQQAAAVAEVEALLPEGPSPAAVQRLVVALDREGRRAVLEAADSWSGCLHEAGVDVAALIAMGDRYVGAGTAEPGGGLQQAPVFGGVQATAEQLGEVSAALLAAAGGSEELQADARRVGGAVEGVRRLWWEYLCADEVGNELLEAWGQLLPADAAALAAAAPVAGSGAQQQEDGDAAGEPLKPSQQLVQRYGPEHLAAYLDYCVAGRVFDRGSGERHFVRLPTYPAFEGAPIRLLDAVRENEVSQLNREVAAAEDASLLRQFQDALVDNLGLTEELQGRAGMAVPQKPADGWSYVVHPFGSTRPLGDGVPKTYVADAARQPRALNELEQQYLRTLDPRRRRKGVR